MSTTDINTIDLTGEDPDFVVTKRYAVFETMQIIDFEEPVFAATIAVTRLYPDGTTSELLEHTAWSTANGALKASNAISQAKLQDSSFAANLVTGIQIIAPVDSKGFQISVTYQAFNRPYLKYPAGTTGPIVTPALVLSMLESIDALNSTMNPTSGITSETLATTAILDEDYTGYGENNYIENETHSVNVPNNKFVIRPANGSFYLHDLKLTYNDTTLVGEKDTPAGKTPEYLVRGANHGKTRVSSNPSGVYDYIIITKSIVGDVKVSYHAFGGDITPTDFNALRDYVIEIINLLTNGRFLTVDNLPQQILIKQILRRLGIIEEMLRHYSQVSFPYTIRKFQYLTNIYSGDNWVDIAHLPHGPWSQVAPIPEMGTGDFRLEIPERKYKADFSLTYNLSDNSVRLDNINIQTTDYQKNGIEHFDSLIIPKFRIVYQSSKLTAGLTLQMSLNSRTEETISVALYDRTGSATLWMIVDTNGEEHANAEMTTKLPDGVTVWTEPSRMIDSTIVNAKTNTISLLPDYYTAWVGSMNVNTIDEQSDKVVYSEGSVDTDTIWVTETAPLTVVSGPGIKLIHTINNGDFTLDQIAGIRVHVYDRFAQQVIVQDSIQVSRVGDNSISTTVMYYVDDLCAISCKIDESINDVAASADPMNKRIITHAIMIKSTTGTNSLNNNRFDLKQIDLIMKGV